MADVVKGDDTYLSNKYLRQPAQNIASDSQAELLAFPWRSCLKLTGEGVEGE